MKVTHDETSGRWYVVDKDGERIRGPYPNENQAEQARRAVAMPVSTQRLAAAAASMGDLPIGSYDDGRADAADDARALLADIEREAADLATLRRLHDEIGDCAQHAANATVAVLSLLPYVATDVRAGDFLGDVMAELGANVSKLAAVQGLAMTLVRSAQSRADDLVSTHSVRV